MAITGIVFDIQRSALHDGPGLRTTVFLKGCPLRCAWCHNPESQEPHPQTGKSGKIYGREMSVPEVMVPVLADCAYYAASGGGLTLSGGEPTQQFEFCRAILQAARAEGIHTCLDTCGQVATEKLLELAPLVDLFHYDFKVEKGRDHLFWTGVDGELIRDNLDALRSRKFVIRLRCPIVPGVNDTSEHEAELSAFEASGDFEAVERLPYHRTGNPKFEDLGLPVPTFGRS